MQVNLYTAIERDWRLEIY